MVMLKSIALRIVHTSSYVRFVLLIFLCGCGMDIDFHENTPREVLLHKAGYPTSGYAWRELNPLSMEWECDIWVAPRDDRSDACWNALIEHEVEHCERGSYHPNTPEGSRIICE